MLFKAPCGQLSTVSVVELVDGLSMEDTEFIDKECDWTAAKHWAMWWM